MCDCLQLEFHLIEDPAPNTNETLFATGTLNGFNTYEFTYDGVTYYIWHNETNDWIVTTEGYGIGIQVTGIKDTDQDCPIASIPVWLPGVFDVFTTSECSFGCNCLNVIIQGSEEGSPTSTYQVNAIGVFNGYNYFEFSYLGTTYTIYWNESQWNVAVDGVGGSAVVALWGEAIDCPATSSWELTPFLVLFETRACGCEKREDRIFKEYGSIKLPDIFVEQNRGLKECCCRQLVLASNQSETWKNDITSAWIKVSSNDDFYSFQLTKNGQPTTYDCTIYEFVNEDHAVYTTIHWKDVLNSDGAGCYKLIVEFSLSGITGSFIWGEYELKPYSVETARTTARVRAIFNGYQENEGIDFTASNVESTHRFHGFIGNMQPNTEIDNLIYSNREMKRVIRENLRDYEINTDPEDECIIRPLHELYLLSENELFISDYNAFNHSYRYLDIPVILKESAQIEYKEFSRKAVLKCKVEDKFKQNRTYYNG